MAEFKKLHVDTSIPTSHPKNTVSIDGHENNFLRRANEGFDSPTDASSSSDQDSHMRHTDQDGSVSAPATNYYKAATLNDGIHLRSVHGPLSHRLTDSDYFNHRTVLLDSMGPSPNSASANSESMARKFTGQSLTQHVANASATALRSRHGSDAERLIYNPITGVPFQSIGSDRSNLSMQACLNRLSPVIFPTSDHVLEAGQEKEALPMSPVSLPNASPRSTHTRSALSQLDSQAYSLSDDDDESAIQIVSRSEPGFDQQGSMERSLSFHLRRQPNSRRVSRRSSTRSFSSSHAMNSPAANFLAGFSRDSAAANATPDAKGQEIGDENHGRYIIGNEMGRGGFSSIKEVHTMQNGENVCRAVKILLKQPKGVSEDDNQKMQLQFEHERVIWSYLPKDKPNILPLLAVFDTEYATFCITEKLPGGSLQSLIRRARRSSSASIASVASTINSGGTKGISISIAKSYILQLAKALQVLHEDLYIVHRDVKLENCLLDNYETSDQPHAGRLMLCDFGMADFISPEDRERYCPAEYHNNPESPPSNSPPRTGSKFVGPGPGSAMIGEVADIGVPGSLPYASPELLQARTPIFDPSVDMWAFGVACYAMIAGRLPFNHEVAAIQRNQILKGEWSEENLVNAFENDAEQEEALELIRGCLNMDPAERWTINQVLGCRFLENQA